MRYEEKFVLDYGSDFFELNVGQYFSQVDERSLQRFLRLAKSHCTEAQRKSLLNSMRVEQYYRLSVLRQLDELWDRRESLLCDAFGTIYSFTPDKKTPEKRLERLTSKLGDRIQIIQKERWNA